MMTDKDHNRILESPYIIDGIPEEATPFEMLESACGREPQTEDAPSRPTIVDETLDPSPGSAEPELSRYREYLAAVLSMGRAQVPPSFSGAWTRSRLASALTASLWRSGHFRLGDLAVSAQWRWNPAPVGGAAGFYASVEAACDSLDGLGIPMKAYSAEESSRSEVAFRVTLSEDAPAPEDEEDEDPAEEETFFAELPFRTEKPRMGRSRKCPEKIAGEPGGWIIYIPFDTCQPALGGSALSQATDVSCGSAPEIYDCDYFLDCYEVVRELAEDGIIRAGTGIAEGGLIAALARMIPEGMDLNVELGGLLKSYGGCTPVQILFSETPGAVAEISDDDFDYLDAELLLQDVAYYPLGRTVPGKGRVSVSTSDSSGLNHILDALIGNQAAEGED